MIVCTSTPVPRSEARSERENATWANFDAEYGAAGVNTIAPAVDAIVAMWERPFVRAASRSPSSRPRVTHTQPR